MVETTIYALVDPRTQAVRYVGKTMQTCAVRLGAHLRRAASGACGHRENWLRELLRAGLVPQVRVLDVVGEQWADSERAWISHYRAAGAPLTNVTLGGDGAPGRVASAATRERIGMCHRGKVESPETRARKSAAHRGRPKIGRAIGVCHHTIRSWVS